ncbi:3015_t:CDS:2, partial [Dentiscutata erythropus]
ITKLNGNEKKCDKTFSIATSTTHLGKHLNSVHKIFSYQQYGKNSDGQTIIDPDKSMPTIPSMFSKIEAHKPVKKQKLLYRLTAWIVDDCQALTIPLLEDEDSESEPEDLIESLEQPTTSQSQKKITYPSSNPFVMLLQLRDAVEQLTRSLRHHPDFQQRKNEQTLSEKLLTNTEWMELEELTLLLGPFAQTTKLIGGTQYPTLSMILPTISLLFTHLYQMKESLTSSNILNICHQIEDSMTKHWEAPLMKAYIASYLDPRFKSMSFDKEKKKEVQEMIAEMIKTNTINTPEQTEMDQFFDGDNQSDYPLDNELE